MKDLRPTVPRNLNPFSRELLESMVGHAEAGEIVIGGGVALSHYLEYRETVDLDAWWKEAPKPEVSAFVEGCMKAMAKRHGLEFRRRTWGETESLELVWEGKKQFSFQISRRTLHLDEAVPAHWRPLWIETLRDNVASKMAALVERGAPRDFADIYELVQRSVAGVDDCWELWSSKNPGMPVDEGKRKVLAKIEAIALSRPLEAIQLQGAREKAALVRAWYRGIFTQPADR